MQRAEGLSSASRAQGLMTRRLVKDLKRRSTQINVNSEEGLIWLVGHVFVASATRVYAITTRPRLSNTPQMALRKTPNSILRPHACQTGPLLLPSFCFNGVGNDIGGNSTPCPVSKFDTCPKPAIDDLALQNITRP